MTDPLKKLVTLILRGKGYTVRECRYGLSGLKDGRKPNRGRIKLFRIHAEFMIRFRRDQGYTGTVAYQGLAYFWAYKYRHTLRDCTNWVRQRVHDQFLAADLELDGETAAHDEIVNRAFDGAGYTQED